MKQFSVISIVLVAAALAIGDQAKACSLATPEIYDATRRPADAIITGQVTSDGVDGQRKTPFADVKVDEVLVGAFSDQNYRLRWWFPSNGRCEPPGPWLKPSQDVRIYLEKTTGGYQALAWELLSDRPKSIETLTDENAVARLRRKRVTQNFHAGGALSLDDPKGWLRLSDLPGVEDWKYGVALSFSVNPWGGMEDCKPAHIEQAAKFDHLACEILVAKARFVPPLFSEETWGYYDWNPWLENLANARKLKN